MHILIARNSSNSQANEAALVLGAFFQAQGIDFTSIDSLEAVQVKAKDYDMIVSLGGDGTILRCAHLVCDEGIPILGLNYGHLGFLTNNPGDGVVSAAAAALAGETTREERANLRIDVLLEGEDEDEFDHVCNEPRDPSSSRCLFALNEAALTRGSTGKIINFGIEVSGEHVADMRGDGIVTATATGSTSYSLSAGGPLVAPGFKGLIVTPVAPHTLVARAILTDASDIVEIRMGETSASREAELFTDGNLIKFEAPIAKVRVRRGEVPTTLLRFNRAPFYEHISETFFKI
ncbi:MAG: NAD(+)/NADH kinase [Eggerthellaceae bacterium]|nr:NAD(+)/NADH kinase [Eggerthellaceae bacterium]